MKLTDIDLSSLAEVAAAVTLLEHVHRGLADRHRERNEPLPTIIPGFVVGTPPQEREGVERFVPVGGQAFVVNPAPSPAGGHTHWQDADAMERFVAAAAEKLRGQDVNPAVAAQPIATVLQQGTQSVAFQSMDECRAALVADAEARRVEPMDAASVFGGAPAQSAAPLHQSAPASAGVAASPTAPAAPPASGTGVTALPALAPLPAPSAAAPTAPAALSSPAGGVELDADGLPWDERIHAGTKRKNDDGRWTKKRGINDPDLVPRVVAQLRAQMAAGGVTTQPAVMPTLPQQPALPANPTSTLAALQAAMAPVVAQSAAPLPPSTPAPSTPPLAALPVTSGPASLASPTPPVLPVAQTPAAPQQYSAPAPTTFQDFMTALTVEVQAGRVPIEALGAACQPLGGVSALNAKPELIPVAWASLKAKYPGML